MHITIEEQRESAKRVVKPCVKFIKKAIHKELIYLFKEEKGVSLDDMFKVTIACLASIDMNILISLIEVIKEKGDDKIDVKIFFRNYIKTLEHMLSDYESGNIEKYK